MAMMDSTQGSDVALLIRLLAYCLGTIDEAKRALADAGVEGVYMDDPPTLAEVRRIVAPLIGSPGDQPDDADNRQQWSHTEPSDDTAR